MSGTMPSPEIEAPLVDGHAHVYTSAIPLAPTAWHKPPADAPVEQYLQTLDRHGITFGVLAAASLYGTNNEYPLDACTRHRRLRTTVIVDPDCTLEQMQAMSTRGAVGVRFVWRRVSELPDLRSPQYRAFLRRIADAGWHLHVLDDSARFPQYLDVFEEAGFPLVIDHFGRPDAQLRTQCKGFRRLLQSVQKGRTWVKVSASFRLEEPGLAQEAAGVLLREAGPERLIWGSDWPFAAFEDRMRYEKALASFVELFPDPAVRRRIAGETPLKLYFA